MLRFHHMLKYLWLAVLAGLTVATAFWPTLDLAATRLYYAPEQGFPAQGWLLPAAIHWLATKTPIWLALALLLRLIWAVIRRQVARLWVFLLLYLLLGPGLVANVMLKDHWGRARPVQVKQFGGAAVFTPWWQPARQCDKNCSFIAGDAAFGFSLAAPGLVLRHRRRWFWSGTAAGIIMGGNRIIMGAHFLSDVAAAGLIMPAALFALHAAFYGGRASMQAWRAL